MNELILPPLLNSVQVAADPFKSAILQLQKRQAGAGDLFWSQSQTKAEMAIVLEPEINRARAVEMLPLVMVALSDCLAVLLPPQVAIQFREEKHLTVNGGVVADVEMAMARNTQNENLEGAPDWLIVSINLEMTLPEGADDPGEHPDITVLSEEGWEEPDLQKLIETFARHFLSWMVNWDDDGFHGVSRAWQFKAENKKAPDMVAILEQVQMFESTASS